MSSSSDSTNSGTRVDLGEDLLTEAEPSAGTSATISLPASLGETQAPSLAERLENARILFNEGMLEEAKKELHQIIIADGTLLPARKLLDEIHEIELKQIFQSEVPRERSEGGAWLDPRRIDTEAIMERLDDDLKLGLNAPELSLLADKEAMKALSSQLDQALLGSTSQDRVDVGIAFMEMGLFEIASRIFRVAARTSSGVEARSASALLAYTLVLAGQAFEATLVIAPILQDGEATVGEKAEFFYLMGRAHEALGRPGQAIGWYRKSQETDPGYQSYRDTEERIVRLG
jgi:tetratricopeptide (TPR) repeat protein